jgi:hypothetical protein
MILTRYLYSKEETEISLLMSLLDHEKDEAMYWAYELYYSGFNEEVFTFLYQIYDCCYESVHPKLREFIYKKPSDTECHLGSIVYTLATREYSLLYQRRFDTSKDLKPHPYGVLVPNYRWNCPLKNSNGLINRNNNGEPFRFFQGIPRLESYFARTITLPNTDDNVEQLRPILKKKLCIIVHPKDIEPFKTKTDSFPRRILDKVIQFPIRQNIYSLLSSTENFCEKKRQILHHSNACWLYYASKSPIWNNRIIEHGGFVNHTTQRVEFSQENIEDSFYELWGYSPDEQCREVQEYLGIYPFEEYSSEPISFEKFAEKYAGIILPKEESPKKDKKMKKIKIKKSISSPKSCELENTIILNTENIQVFNPMQYM